MGQVRGRIIVASGFALHSPLKHGGERGYNKSIALPLDISQTIAKKKGGNKGVGGSGFHSKGEGEKDVRNQRDSGWKGDQRAGVGCESITPQLEINLGGKPTPLPRIWVIPLGWDTKNGAKG